MSANTLLRMHAERWAEAKKRPLDGDLLETVVGLHQSYEDLEPTCWPAGSAEALLLTRWPAHGPLDLPDLDTLRDTLDTYWRFLRSTGRMSSESAAPADLLKEARRALPKMAKACSDRTRFSQGRILQDFGRTLGISLDDAADADDLNTRLQQITTAWNELPIAERQRLMPDPSPKTRTGQTLTEAVNPFVRQESGYDEADEDDETDVPLRRGDARIAARQTRESAFVQACLALARWVGEGREVTATGVLRPAVARQALADLNLIEWQREWRLRVDIPRWKEDEYAEEVGALMDEVSLDCWRSAGECIPLDRLWFSCDAAHLLEIGSRKARRADREIANDADWLVLGLALVYGLVQRFTGYRAQPLMTILISLALADDGRVDLDDLRARRLARSPIAGVGSDPQWQETVTRIENDRLDWVLQMFADTALWVRVDDQLTVTDFGREFTVVYVNALDEGLLDDDF